MRFNLTCIQKLRSYRDFAIIYTDNCYELQQTTLTVFIQFCLLQFLGIRRLRPEKQNVSTETAAVFSHILRPLIFLYFNSRVTRPSSDSCFLSSLFKNEPSSQLKQNLFLAQQGTENKKIFIQEHRSFILTLACVNQAQGPDYLQATRQN